MRTAYGLQPSVSTGIDGRGIDVAIVDAYANPTMLADSNDYSTSQGEPAFAAGQYTEHTFTPFSEQSACGGEAGWNTEESLDVEAVHAMAPGANVHYVGAANCDAGIDDALNYVVENHVADIVSDSFGSTGEDNLGSELTTEHAIFVAAAAEGIGFYFSSGDDGDNVTLNKTLKAEPDYPASDPYVTGVGGTSLAITSSSSYQFETSWGDDVDPISGGRLTYTMPGPFYYGAGGGVSALYSQPSYQAGIVPSSLAKGKRVVPDIAADADPATGFLIEYDGDLYTYGGTSLACPLIAGLQAVVSQGRIVPIGFANPALYALNGNAFHDVTAPASTTTTDDPERQCAVHDRARFDVDRHVRLRRQHRSRYAQRPDLHPRRASAFVDDGRKLHSHAVADTEYFGAVPIRGCGPYLFIESGLQRHLTTDTLAAPPAVSAGFGYVEGNVCE